MLLRLLDKLLVQAHSGASRISLSNGSFAKLESTYWAAGCLARRSTGRAFGAHQLANVRARNRRMIYREPLWGLC